MKCFSLFFQKSAGTLVARVVAGIVTTLTKKGEETHQSVVLGRYGAGQWCNRVGFFHKEPPVVKNGRIYSAELMKLEDRKASTPEMLKYFHLLSAEDGNTDTRILIRVTGIWPSEGDGLPLGWFKNGNARVEEGLVILEPGDILPVHSSDDGATTVGLYYDTRVGVRIITADEYRQFRLANQPTLIEVVALAPVEPPVAPAPKRKPRAKKAVAAE
ncbi:MAG: hypothetical protein WCO21_01425 [bacterium]